MRAGLIASTEAVLLAGAEPDRVRGAEDPAQLFCFAPVNTAESARYTDSLFYREGIAIAMACTLSRIQQPAHLTMPAFHQVREWGRGD